MSKSKKESLKKDNIDIKTYTVVPILTKVTPALSQKWNIDVVLHQGELCDVYEVNDDNEKFEIGVQDSVLKSFGRKLVSFDECDFIFYIKTSLSGQDTYPIIVAKPEKNGSKNYRNCRNQEEYLEAISKGYYIEVGPANVVDSYTIFENNLLNKSVRVNLEVSNNYSYNYTLDEKWLEEVIKNSNTEAEDMQKEIKEIEQKQQWIEQRKELYSLIIKSKSFSQFVNELSAYADDVKKDEVESEQLNLVF
jgi:hypothetical protein